MGPRHSKRSVDMAGTPSKSEIEGVGNAGKLEKIVDGIVEKVATNGHVDGELQNGAEPVQNGLEPVQNGEAAAVAYENSIEKIKDLKIDEKDREIVNGVNGEVEEKINCENDEKTDLDTKEEKKDKKKDKKEKIVKKKFSFRSFSFSKKDKSKPKTSDTETKIGIEESPEAVLEDGEPNVEELKESEPEQLMNEPEEQGEEGEKSVTSIPSPAALSATVSEVVIVEAPAASIVEKIASADDLPPPLPASPPPTEVKEDVIMQETEVQEEVKELEAMPRETEETTNEVLTMSEQIEEKATDLLKVVEDKLERKRNESEGEEEDEKLDMNDEVASADVIQVKDEVSATVVEEAASKPEESVINDIVTLSQNAEETSDKQEEFGAGESLAEMDVVPDVTPNTNEVVVME